MADRTIEISSRQGTRIPKTFSLSYEDKESFVVAYTENVSVGGLFIRTENPFEPGEQFVLKLQLPGLTDPMKIKCEVAWAARARKQGEKTDVRHGMGVKFIETTNKDSQTLKQYLGH
jgi:type IV pilus assembly protein PilZ